MLQKITYRQKLKYLGILTVLLLVICYKLSISKAISEYRKYKQYESAVYSYGNDEQTLRLLQNKDNVLKGIMTRYLLDTTDQDKNLLGIAGAFCNENNLQVTNFQPYPSTQSDSISTVSRSITVQGNFRNCLSLVYHLETKTEVGRIGSVLFKTLTTPGTGEKTLLCTVIVQNIIPLSNESN